MLFFQAEDGIRVLVRSRGLGEVYKRQHQRLPLLAALFFTAKREAPGRHQVGHVAGVHLGPVSYTHLTLPTSDLV